ncbi:DUF6221 family protein [Geodermatophilus sp. URMC 64]
MEPDSGLEPDREPNLDEFLLARIAEDKRIAVDAAEGSGQQRWHHGDGALGSLPPFVAEHAAHHDPARTIAECAARRRLVMACRDIGPDLHFLGARPHGLADFFLTPSDQHQLAALTLALLALPYAEHHDYRPEWRP